MVPSYFRLDPEEPHADMEEDLLQLDDDGSDVVDDVESVRAKRKRPSDDSAQQKKAGPKAKAEPKTKAKAKAKTKEKAKSASKKPKACPKKKPLAQNKEKVEETIERVRKELKQLQGMGKQASPQEEEARQLAIKTKKEAWHHYLCHIGLSLFSALAK